MRINSTPYNVQISKNDNQYAPQFGAWTRVVYRPTIKGRELVHRNNTSLNREPKEITKLMKIMKKLYAKEPKINFYDYGCSGGYEPITYLIYLYSKFPELADKIEKILARDVDPVAIEKAKNGMLSLDSMEIIDTNDAIKGNLTEFLRFLNPNTSTKTSELSPKIYSCERNIEGTVSGDIYTVENVLQDLRDDKFQYDIVPAMLRGKYRDKIDYQVADILEDCENIEPRCSVVSARNFWPYLKPDKVIELIEKLNSVLESKCVLITGGFDKTTKHVDIKEELMRRGFECPHKDTSREKYHHGQIFVRK